MVRNLNGRLQEIKVMVDNGDYFVISRARQYRKTTTLCALKRYLAPDYIVIFMSFQKMSSAKFRDEYAFSRAFARDFIKKAEVEIKMADPGRDSLAELERQWKEEPEAFDLSELFESLSNICMSVTKKLC